MGLVIPALVLSFIGSTPVEVQLDATLSHIAPPALAGANGNIWSNYFEMDHPLFVDAMEELHVTAYRYPGGTVANGHDPLTGKMYPNLREPSWGIYNERHPNGVTFSDYVQLTNTFENPQQQYVVNMLSRPNPDGSGDGVILITDEDFQIEANRLQPFLASMVNEGFNPAFLEYTNEIYLPMYNKLGFEKSIEDYENRITAFSPMLRSVFPETPFAAVLPLSELYRNKEGAEGDLGNLEVWVVDQKLDFQAIVLHAYVVGTHEIKQFIEEDNNSLEEVMTNWMVQTELGLIATMEYTNKMYPTKEVWMTEWGILISNIDGQTYEPILRNCTLVSMQAASMFVEMLKYPSIKLANHHGMVPMLNPIYDEEHNLLSFNRTTHGDIAAHMNELLSTEPTVLHSVIANVGEVTAPIINPNGSGWGNYSAPAISSVLVESEGDYHWLAVNRMPTNQEAQFNLNDLNISAADIEVYKFYTDAILPIGSPFAGTLDLFEPATQEIIELTLEDSSTVLEMPAMGMVDMKIQMKSADVTRDWHVNIDDLLAVIGAWGPCESCIEDINQSGTVDVGDLLIVLDQWG